MNLRRRMERDLERDIQDHIEMETRENIERGMSPEEARSAARRKFGNVLRVMEETRAVWRWMWFERLLHYAPNEYRPELRLTVDLLRQTGARCTAHHIYRWSVPFLEQSLKLNGGLAEEDANPRGPQIMRGYRGLARETDEALRYGWLYTGDIGELDADGYLYIRDRKKDMVIVSGFNVYPREVEEVLYAHPAVLEAAVVGVPDSYRGEALVGFVVPAGLPPQPDDLRTYLAERLVHYKVPCEIRIVESLPKTTVGKVDKRLLRGMSSNPQTRGSATP